MSKVTFKQEQCLCPYCGTSSSIYIGVPILDSVEKCYKCGETFLCHIEPIIYSTFKREDDHE